MSAAARISAITGSGGRKGLTRAYFRDTVNKRWYWTTTLAGGTGTWTELEDSKGRVCQVKNALSQFFNIYFNALGQPVKHTYSTGAWTDYTYDTAERLQSLTMRLSNGNLLDQLRYTYTATGRMASEIDAGNRVHAFQYNKRGELFDEQHRTWGWAASSTRMMPTAIGRRWCATGSTSSTATTWAARPGNPDKLLWKLSPRLLDIDCLQPRA